MEPDWSWSPELGQNQRIRILSSPFQLRSNDWGIWHILLIDTTSWKQCISINIGHSIPLISSVNVTQVKGIASVVRTNYIYSFNHSQPSGYYFYQLFITQQSNFLPHTEYLCILYASEKKKAIIFLYSINWLHFITQKECVYCPVRTGWLNRYNSR